MPGVANYAALSDISAYAPNTVQTEEQAIWTTFLGLVSRDIDTYTGRYFYDDGAAVRYFDGNGTSKLYIDGHDVSGITLLRIANFENADPASSTDWTTISGDGVTPPSNFYLEPKNPKYIGSGASTLRRPYWRIELPAQSGALTGATAAQTFPAGKRTVEVTASHWGWQAIPDELKDLTAKVVLRMWKAREAGWTGQIGSPDLNPGPLSMLRYLDINDLATLTNYRRQEAF